MLITSLTTCIVERLFHHSSSWWCWMPWTRSSTQTLQFDAMSWVFARVYISFSVFFFSGNYFMLFCSHRRRFLAQFMPRRMKPIILITEQLCRTRIYNDRERWNEVEKISWTREGEREIHHKLQLQLAGRWGTTVQMEDDEAFWLDFFFCFCFFGILMSTNDVHLSLTSANARFFFDSIATHWSHASASTRERNMKNEKWLDESIARAKREKNGKIDDFFSLCWLLFVHRWILQLLLFEVLRNLFHLLVRSPAKEVNRLSAASSIRCRTRDNFAAKLCIANCISAH